MGLVTLGEMLVELVAAIETPPAGIRILDVQGIRAHRAEIGRQRSDEKLSAASDVRSVTSLSKN